MAKRADSCVELSGILSRLVEVEKPAGFSVYGSVDGQY